MKATLKRFFKRLLGLSVPPSVEEGVVVDSGKANTGVRIPRLPFFLVHVLAYAVLYFCTSLAQSVYAGKGQAFTIGEFGLTLILFISTILLLPVYLRRAHDLGWSLKHVVWFAVIPSFLRLILLIIPLMILLNQGLMSTLLAYMPFIGFAYWLLQQVQIFFTAVLMFAPGTGTHNKYGTEVSRSFTLRNLYGYSVLKNKKVVKVAEVKK